LTLAAPSAGHTQNADHAAAPETTIRPFEHDGRLETVLQHLQSATGVTIRPLWRDLEQANITADTPVSIQFIRPVTLEKALHLILADISHEAEPLAHARSANQRTIKIATQSLMDTEVAVQVYDVRDMIWDAEATKRAPSLEDLLTTTIEPTIWKRNGGTDSSLTTLNGQLVVTTTPRNHEQIKALLERLRAVKREKRPHMDADSPE
jgi:hypothetical protein